MASSVYSGSGVPTRDLAGNWTLDASASTVHFTVRHMGFLRVVGTLPVVGGRVEINADGAGGELRAEFDPAGFDTGNAKRDEHVRTADFLDVERFPRMRFTATTVSGGAGELTVPGTLEVKGVSRPVPLTVTPEEVADGRATLHATGVVDRNAFGVTKARGMVGRNLKIDIRAVLVRSTTSRG
jgi:polyisoprenoid-binding protein YceI